MFFLPVFALFFTLKKKGVACIIQKRETCCLLTDYSRFFSPVHMKSSNPKLGSLIVQLHNRHNEAKEAFDQALVELERQKTENDRQYQQQLEQLNEERQQWHEENATMEQLVASASPIVNLNVGGEKMSTLRSTLTLAEGSLLATMFSGKWEHKLVKDTYGYIFLDYDPVVSRNVACFLLIH
jgi:hypothetical protein